MKRFLPERKFILATKLCDRVNCSSNGYCIVRNYNGPAEASCTCKVPYFGEYCHIQGEIYTKLLFTQCLIIELFLGAVTSCSTGYCNNGGACKEFIGGTTKYAYCECAPGYNGIRCENRTISNNFVAASSDN